jgi:hypothetical protein
VLKRKFSLKNPKLYTQRDGMYDSTDPLFEDNPSHLARDFKNNPEGLKDHFEEKERSINALEQDIPEEELDS